VADSKVESVEPSGPSRIEDVYAGLIGLSRVLALEHRLLRQQLSAAPADSEEGRTLEGLVSLGTLIEQRLTHLIAQCREAGRL